MGALDSVYVVFFFLLVGFGPFQFHHLHVFYSTFHVQVVIDYKVNEYIYPLLLGG